MVKVTTTQLAHLIKGNTNACGFVTIAVNDPDEHVSVKFKDPNATLAERYIMTRRIVGRLKSRILLEKGDIIRVNRSGDLSPSINSSFCRGSVSFLHSKCFEVGVNIIGGKERPYLKEINLVEGDFKVLEPRKSMCSLTYKRLQEILIGEHLVYCAELTYDATPIRLSFHRYDPITTINAIQLNTEIWYGQHRDNCTVIHPRWVNNEVLAIYDSLISVSPTTGLIKIYYRKNEDACRERVLNLLRENQLHFALTPNEYNENFTGHWIIFSQLDAKLIEVQPEVEEV